MQYGNGSIEVAYYIKINLGVGHQSINKHKVNFILEHKIYSASKDMPSVLAIKSALEERERLNVIKANSKPALPRKRATVKHSWRLVGSLWKRQSEHDHGVSIAPLDIDGDAVMADPVADVEEAPARDAAPMLDDGTANPSLIVEEAPAHDVPPIVEVDKPAEDMSSTVYDANPADKIGVSADLSIGDLSLAAEPPIMAAPSSMLDQEPA